MPNDPLGRIVDVVTDHNVATLLVILLLSGVMVVGVTQVNTASQASADSGAFNDVERVEKANYVDANYGQTERNPNLTVQQVYVRDSGGEVLESQSLLAGLRYQQAIRENDSVRTSLHEAGTIGISNLVASRLAPGSTPSLQAQIDALENASDHRVDRAVDATLQNNAEAMRFLPSDHEPSVTSATDRRIIVAFDTAVNETTRDRAEGALYEQAENTENATLFTLGGPAIEDYRSHYFGQMIELVVPAALLLILAVLAFSYRDLVDIVVGMTGVVLSILWMFGLLGWLDVAAGQLSIIPVVLITGLSIDFGFHVFNRYREQRGAGDGIRESMGRGVKLVTTALVLVTTTAAIGFLSNLANPLPVIRNLGISITLGVVSALVLFVTIVPALKITIDRLLERVGLDRRKQALGRGTYLKPILSGSVTLARRAAPVVVGVAILVGAAGGMAWMELEQESYQGSGGGDIAEWKQDLPDPVGWETSPYADRAEHVKQTYQPTGSDARQSQILIESDVTQPGTLENIQAGISDINDAGLLLDASGSQLVQSPTTVMQRVARTDETFADMFERSDTDNDGVPDRNVEGLYDALYAADNELASSVIERTNDEYRSVLVTMPLTASWQTTDSTVATLTDAASTMASDGGSATVIGSLALNATILDELTESILLTMVIALLAIVVTLSAVFRLMHGSATLGAVVSVPITLVVGMVIGGMALLDIPLTLLTALLMSLVIGLGVDYNIHIGDRFADELRDGKGTYEALSLAVTGTGGALLGSTLTSAGAFLTIMLVPSAQLQSFGAMVVTALVTSFVVSVVVLPSGLVLWRQGSSIDLGTPAANEDVLPQD